MADGDSSVKVMWLISLSTAVMNESPLPTPSFLRSISHPPRQHTQDHDIGVPRQNYHRQARLEAPGGFDHFANQPGSARRPDDDRQSVVQAGRGADPVRG